MNEPHFQRLLDLYFDGGLQAEELAELERILLSNKQARNAFWENAHLHQALSRSGAESWGARAAESESKHQQVTARRWVLSIAALIIVSLTTWFLLNPKDKVNETIVETPSTSVEPSSSLPSRTAPQPNPVAVISEMAGAQWEASPNLRLRKGSAIETGEITLRSGLVGITFFNGAHAVIKGPARLNILSDSSMQIIRGDVHIECPEVARGFTVLTPGGRVVDLGTVFGLSVDDEGTTEVQVVKGLVMMRGNAERIDTELHEQEAAAIGMTGLIQLREKTEKIISKSFVQNIHDQEQQRFERWKKNSAQRVGDKDLLVYLRMLDDKNSNAHLVNNEGGSGAASTNAVVISPNWEEGRWSGKRALLFQDADERARIEIKGSYPEVTFAAWVRIVDFQRPFNALFMSDGGMDGEVHWQFSQFGGFRFSMRPTKAWAQKNKLGGGFHRTWTDAMLHPSDNGAWRHLITSYDAKNKRVIHYIDGQEVTRHPLPESVPLGFGKATIGNTSYATKQYWGSRQFGGAVDEFAIFSRVLSPQEIIDLYKEGLPN